MVDSMQVITQYPEKMFIRTLKHASNERTQSGQRFVDFYHIDENFG